MLNNATLAIVKTLPSDQVIPFLEGTWTPGETELLPEISSQIAVNKEFAPICEAKPGKNIRVKLISPGQGTSGYYPIDVLKRDGPNVFKAGLKMFWDHATEAERNARPEGSLSRLAGVLKSDAVWEDHPIHGAGLYADAAPLNGYGDSIRELAEHDAFGVSIRGGGVARKAQVAGTVTNIFEKLVTAESCDFVTAAGRGGKVVQIFESARPAAVPDEKVKEKGKMAEIDDKELTRLKESASRVETLIPTIESLTKRAITAEAKEQIREALATSKLAEKAHPKVMRECLASVPVKDGDLDATAFKGIIEASIAEYILLVGERTVAAGVPAITGLGESRMFSGSGTQTVDLSESAKAIEDNSFLLAGIKRKTA